MSLRTSKKAQKGLKVQRTTEMQPHSSNAQVQPHTGQTCCAASLSQSHQADDFVDFLDQIYPDDRTVIGQYNTQLGLHRLDEVVHTRSEQSLKATHTVNNGIQDIQNRLGNMEEALKGTVEATKTWGEEERRRRAEKADQKRLQREQGADREVERLKGLVDKGANSDKKGGLDEMAVLKLLEERDLRLELERYKSLQSERVKKESTNDSINKVQLQKLLDQREQLKELQRLQALESSPHKEYLEQADLLEILDKRDRERELARLQRLEKDKAESFEHGEKSSQEHRLRQILEDHEQRREFDHFRAFEAKTHQREAKDFLRSDDTVSASLPEIERLIEDILERHDRRQGYERKPEYTRLGRRQKPTARSSIEHLQRAVDEIMALLLHRQSIGDAMYALDNLLRRAESANLQDSRSNARHWVLAEVCRYLDTYMLERQRGNDFYAPYRSHHGNSACRYDCGTTPPSFRAHADNSPPPSYRPHSTGTQRWSPSRVQSQNPEPTPSYWERAPEFDHLYTDR